MFDAEQFGLRIKELRLKRGISTIRLAKELCVSDATISRWENAVITPKAEYIYAMSKYFSVTAGFLLGLEKVEV